MTRSHLLSLLLLTTLSVAATPKPANINTVSSKTTEVQIGTPGDDLKFDRTLLKAKAGSTLKITFTNRASKSSGLQHNLVVTQPGKAEEVANAGIVAGPDKSYVPDSPQVLAKTKLLTAGQSESILVRIPETPAEYPFLCTFPGHSITMKGIIRAS